ncbi:unnamed protein product [Prorocentrum cordatum]|uniref:C2H2-type domain-containing protein n=1 Tax=Prorocentrum cordatum TaxID=2364126 RepID=A0ABN9VK32_9DINO|nr:unnamed protein product [Polarella glacialis]
MEGGTDTKKFICYPCKRKFPSGGMLARHERMSDSHRRTMEKREDKMRKRKRELIMAARTIRQLIMEREEEISAQVSSAETAATQRTVLQMKLQQLLREYGMAQEVIEACRQLREAKEAGQAAPSLTFEAKVGKLQLTAGAACWQSNKVHHGRSPQRKRAINISSQNITMPKPGRDATWCKVCGKFCYNDQLEKLDFTCQ